MIVVIDNYDSFTYNLVQYLKIIGSEVVVFRNDAVSLSKLEEMAPAGFVISPGPGRPETAGISMPLISSRSEVSSFMMRFAFLRLPKQHLQRVIMFRSCCAARARFLAEKRTNALKSVFLIG